MTKKTEPTDGKIIELKKVTSPDEINRAGEEALAGSEINSPTDPGNGLSDLPKTESGDNNNIKPKPGRKLGVKFPGGYKKGKKEVKADRPQQINLGTEELLDAVFNSLLGEQYPHLKLAPEQVQLLAGPTEGTLNDLFPGMGGTMNNKWTGRILIFLMILGPKLINHLKFMKGKIKNAPAPASPSQIIEPEKPKEESSQPRAREFNASAGPEGTWQNNLAQADPEKGTP